MAATAVSSEAVAVAVDPEQDSSRRRRRAVDRRGGRSSRSCPGGRRAQRLQWAQRSRIVEL